MAMVLLGHGDGRHPTRPMVGRDRGTAPKTGKASGMGRKMGKVKTMSNSASQIAKAEAKAEQAAEAIQVTQEAMAEASARDAANEAVKTRVESFRTMATDASLEAYGHADGYTYKATLAMALNLVAESFQATLLGLTVEPSKDSFIFKRDVIHKLALAGRPVWRNSEDRVDAIRKASGIERDKLVAAYTNAEGEKMVEGVANLRTNSFRLAKWARANIGPQLREIAILASTPTNDGSPHLQAAVDSWERHVSAVFGTSHASLSARLADIAKAASDKAKADREAKKADKVESNKVESGDKPEESAKPEAPTYDGVQLVADALAICERMEPADLASFMVRLKAIAERAGLHKPEAKPEAVLELTAEPEAKAEPDGRTNPEPGVAGPTLEAGPEAKPEAKGKGKGKRKAA